MLTRLQSIEGMLRQQDGIRSVKVALLAERGVVEYDPAVWNPDKIAEVRIPIVLAYSRSPSSRKYQTSVSMLHTFPQAAQTRSTFEYTA